MIPEGWIRKEKVNGNEILKNNVWEGGDTKGNNRSKNEISKGNSERKRSEMLSRNNSNLTSFKGYGC